MKGSLTGLGNFPKFSQKVGGKDGRACHNQAFNLVKKGREKKIRDSLDGQLKGRMGSGRSGEKGESDKPVLKLYTKARKNRNKRLNQA